MTIAADENRSRRGRTLLPPPLGRVGAGGNCGVAVLGAAPQPDEHDQESHDDGHHRAADDADDELHLASVAAALSSAKHRQTGTDQPRVWGLDKSILIGIAHITTSSTTRKPCLQLEGLTQRRVKQLTGIARSVPMRVCECICEAMSNDGSAHGATSVFRQHKLVAKKELHKHLKREV